MSWQRCDGGVDMNDELKRRIIRRAIKENRCFVRYMGLLYYVDVKKDEVYLQNEYK